VFSFVPRCQGLCGSAKNTGSPVSTLNCACADISLPRSQVSDRGALVGAWLHRPQPQLAHQVGDRPTLHSWPSRFS
jgi:hypothetical protein